MLVNSIAAHAEVVNGTIVLYFECLIRYSRQYVAAQPVRINRLLPRFRLPYLSNTSKIGRKKSMIMAAKIKIIGAVGQNGSGKDEVLKYLRLKYGVPFLSTGDIVREIASKEGVEPTRENLGKISDRYFSKLGKGYFVKLLADKIRHTGWKIAGISGIRSLNDVSILKAIFGNDFILIDVHISDPHVRYSRMAARGEGRDPHSYEQFLQQDRAEEELFSLKEAEHKADYSITNDGTLDDLHREIDRLVSDKGLLTVQ
jgi:dephospho-CoA kinase